MLYLCFTLAWNVIICTSMPVLSTTDSTTCKYLYMSCKFFSLKHHSKLARAHSQTNTHAHTHAPISAHTHAFTSHIYYLNHVFCFISCSCVLLFVFSFFAVLLSYMICTIMEEIKHIYSKDIKPNPLSFCN